MATSRGLAALILTLLFSTSLFAEYLYKDEVINIEPFAQQIERIGAELHEKSGVGVYLIVLKEFDQNQSIIDYEREAIKMIKEPAVLLTFSEMDKQVDIFASPESLYKDFDKESILSPLASFGGTIIPLLTAKARDIPVKEKYAAALTNGYADITEQIADSRDIVLEHAVGSGSKTFINIIRVIFYGMIVYGLFFYIKRKYFTKKSIDE